MPKYFAFGANMDLPAMAERCPNSAVLGLGRLLDHRFFVSVDGFASVRAEQGATVFGLVWQLHVGDLAALDAYEEVEAGLYTRREHSIIQPDETFHRAFLYVARSDDAGEPHPGYMEAVMAAAVAAAFPATYLAELRRWLPTRVPGQG